MIAEARAVFLDRDGTLIEDAGYLSDPAGVRVLPGVPEALRRLREAGYLLVLVTNQSGIARGLFTEEDYKAVHAAMLAAIGIPLDGAYHCPHGPEHFCDCRKPAPGMLLLASAEIGVDLEGSWIVGDHERDALAGLAVGCRAIRIGGGEPPDGSDAAEDFPAAVELILGGDAVSLAGVEVAILGDLPADVTVRGEPTGFARQDAAPILSHRDETVEAGRAGAAARAVAALGGVPRLVGVVGEDRRGEQVLASLDSRGIDTAGILRVPGFETPFRLRVLIGGGSREDRMLVRVDREPRGKPPPGASGEILTRLRARSDAAAALFLDGGHGIASPGAAELVRGVKVALSHDRQDSFREMTALVLDEEGAHRATGRVVAGDGPARAAAHSILEASGARHLLLVRGRLPALWFGAEGTEIRLDPAAGPAAGEAERAAGALALALGAGLAPDEAAAVAVTVPGT